MFEKRNKDHNCTSQNLDRLDEIKRDAEKDARKKVFGSIFTFCAGVVVATLAIGNMNKNK